MTALTYTILTDPAPLEASAAGRQSKSIGTVHLVVTNTARRTDWSTIEVKVPVGDGAGDLTPNIPEMKGTYTENQWGAQERTREVNIERQQGTNVFKVTPQTGGTASFRFGDYMVLTLENFTVASTAGPTVLTVREKTEDDDGEHTRYTSVALVKTAPKEIPAPRDFRPDKAMVDAGEDLTLSWEGSADFTYEIRFPGGQAAITPGTRTWSPADAPKRATTYILVATDPSTQKQHFLTTTVQVRYPVLETLTATTGIDTPWVQGTANKGRVTFTGAGVEISNDSGGQGAVTADRADLNGVNTEWVQGRSTDDGKITFPKDGLNIRQGSGAWGTVHADKADLNGINTEWVQGRSTDDGKITFPKDGLNIRQGSGAWGTVHADKADLNGINTEWVQGRSTDDGWISFPKEGLNVRKGAGQDWGIVFADKADVNSVITNQVQGAGEGKGYIKFLEKDKGVRIFGGVSAGWIRGLNDGEAWIRFNEKGIWVLKNQNGKRESANVTCSTVNDRPA
ncbi:hypothetical protein FHS43_001507 [Streptosporangium becharense]|uniref:Uncharacterized protein n=1 Tax=Streptosporangium becharense TaxID=1816182 RepID=A0A7W9MJ84_9ACTN|nr:hypothetical protein [Streptosporangium becharense]MBB2910244.1 hypothetical protein [Streptosporangium becharense]MBB5822987.1 hypothetical protein [Streptosporangium becharense]